MAQWLDTVCLGFDMAILEAIHQFAVATGGAFTPFMRFISFFADKAICMFLIGFLLLIPARTRKVGACVFGAVCFGALFTNIILKDIVARPRPYVDVARPIYEWWQYVGANVESDLSFPSGHTTAATAAMLGLFLSTKKRYAFPALLFPLLMGLSRMYLMVHYPTDVIGGLISGALGAVCAYYTTKGIWYLLEKHRDKAFCKFALTFDPIALLFRRKKAAESANTEQDTTVETEVE